MLTYHLLHATMEQEHEFCLDFKRNEKHHQQQQRRTYNRFLCFVCFTFLLCHLFITFCYMAALCHINNNTNLNTIMMFYIYMHNERACDTRKIEDFYQRKFAMIRNPFWSDVLEVGCY